MGENGKVVVKISVYQRHRQTIQYISPEDSVKATTAELLVIDEAAAIPLPLVKTLLSTNSLVFIASTINGYEGTGRSLSLKLIADLRARSARTLVNSHSTTLQGDLPPAAAPYKQKKRSMPEGGDADTALDTVPQPAQPAVPVALDRHSSDRVLVEVNMEEPIRYAPGDAVESWLYRVLCLDVTQLKMSSSGLGRVSSPTECSLYWVDRDTLFSHHPVAEAFLKKLMSLFVSSHYKNTPNDLMLLSDAPAHHIFVLLGPVSKKSEDGVPDVLCAIQVALEGEISKVSALQGLARGEKKQGDLIPWTVAQQFQDPDFAALSGARVVRIATQMECARMGYGTRALELLGDYFDGNILMDDAAPHVPSARKIELSDDNVLLEEEVKVRTNLSPLLVPVSRRPPETLHWLGTAFGMSYDDVINDA